MTHKFEVNVGDHVFLDGGGEEIGAVRKIERDHLVVYVEAAGDFIVRGPEVKAIHYGKVVLAPELVDTKLLEAARYAHEKGNRTSTAPRCSARCATALGVPVRSP